MQAVPLTDSDVNDEASLRYAGWRVAIACFAMAVFSWGFGFYGQGVYLAALARQHHWDVSLISGASTTYYLSSAVLVMFVGDAILRFSPRRVVLFGIACLGVSTILVGQVDAIWQLYADYVLMSLGWATTSLAAISTIVGAWFDKRRGLAISLALTGASAGGVAVTPVLVILIERIGLSFALVYAVVAVVIVLVPITRWIRSPSDRDLSADHGGSPAHAAGFSWTRRRALKDLGFWTVSGATALVLFAQVGFLVHQIAFLEPRIGRAEAGIAVAITTGMAVTGRLTLGSIIDRFDPRLVGALSYLSQTAALLAMIWTTNAVGLLVACAIYGFSVGNVLVFPSLIIQREFAGPAFPKLISLSLAISQFVYALGPGTLGMLRSATGSYHASLVLCVAAEFSAVIVILIRDGRKPAPEPPQIRQ